MYAFPTIYAKTIKLFHHWLRETTYDDMARQTSAWSPTEPGVEQEQDSKPITIDFSIPKKHRLGWIMRTLRQPLS